MHNDTIGRVKPDLRLVFQLTVIVELHGSLNELSSVGMTYIDGCVSKSSIVRMTFSALIVRQCHHRNDQFLPADTFTTSILSVSTLRMKSRGVEVVPLSNAQSASSSKDQRESVERLALRSAVNCYLKSFIRKQTLTISTGFHIVAISSPVVHR